MHERKGQYYYFRPRFYDGMAATSEMIAEYGAKLVAKIGERIDARRTKITEVEGVTVIELPRHKIKVVDSTVEPEITSLMNRE